MFTNISDFESFGAAICIRALFIGASYEFGKWY